MKWKFLADEVVKENKKLPQADCSGESMLAINSKQSTFNVVAFNDKGILENEKNRQSFPIAAQKQKTHRHYIFLDTDDDDRLNLQRDRKKPQRKLSEWEFH